MFMLKFNRGGRVKKKSKKKFLFIVIILLLIITCSILYFYKDKPIKGLIKIINEEKINFNDYYSDFVKTTSEKTLYQKVDDKFKEIGVVSSDVILSLDKDDNSNKGYFKIKDSDYYIDYKDIESSEEETKDIYWNNYIPFNESIKTIDKTNLYIDDKLIYSFNNSMDFYVLIKEDNYYGIIYKDNLYYIKKDECEIYENHNTDLKHTSAISALVYHATYDHENSDEKKRCINANSTICLSDIVFDEQMKYLVDNNFYTATMKDLEMFIDGKVQLPEHTVVITIDDGYYADAAVKVLEKYNLHATLFLIGELANVDEYKTDAWYSSSLELHSHTYNMHNPGRCSGGQGSILKCGDRNMLLEDLRKSREQLNGSTVFCYPFFEYNDYAINILKEAGFKMAFAGGRKKIKVGSNKMTLPRYGIINTSTMSDFKNVIY